MSVLLHHDGARRHSVEWSALHKIRSDSYLTSPMFLICSAKIRLDQIVGFHHTLSYHVPRSLADRSIYLSISLSLSYLILSYLILSLSLSYLILSYLILSLSPAVFTCFLPPSKFWGTCSPSSPPSWASCRPAGRCDARDARRSSYALPTTRPPTTRIGGLGMTVGG